MKQTIIIILAVLGFFLSCERDDICPETTQVTPLLIIRFFNADNITADNLKAVPLLAIRGIDKDSLLTAYPGTTNLDSIAVPLKTTGVSSPLITQYVLTRNYKNSTNENEDIITIEYETEQEFVTRACGFKTIFKNISVTLQSDNSNWIKIIRPTTENQIITNDLTAHFKIYH